MAKRIKKVYNTKLLYRWSLPLWLTLFFILLVIAPLVVSVFMQCFAFSSDNLYEINSMNLVMNLFQQPSDSTAAFQNQIVAPAMAANQVIGMVLDIAFKYVIPGFGLTVALFDVILVIFFLVGLFSGRFHHWKGPFALAVWATVQAFFYFGLMIGLSIYLGTQFTSMTFSFMYAIIYLAVMLVAAIALGIIYSAGFKNKEFIPNQEYLDNYIQQQNHGMSNSIGYTPQPIIINNNPAPAIQPVEQVKPQIVQQQPQQPVIVHAPQPEKVVETRVVTKVKKVHETEVDQSLKYISGHAYAKNVHLLSATIPEGVEKIGASAFANCVNMKEATIPTSVKEIGYNAFFNCKSLEKIVYAGRKDQWRKIKRGSNWLSKAGTTIVSCVDGAIQVNPFRK